MDGSSRSGTVVSRRDAGARGDGRIEGSSAVVRGTYARAGASPAAALAACVLALFCASAPAAELWVGAATTDITPDRPVALDGHRNLRVSDKIESRITATALAIESREGDRAPDCAIIVSCDIVAIRDGIREKVREKVKPRLPGFDARKLILCATHTHNAPVTVEGKYTLPEGGIMRPSEYAEFMTERVADAIVSAWEGRKRGAAGWGQGQAVVAKNRRAVYADGTAKMYGATNGDDFRGIEGYEDHDMDALFFWGEGGRLIATAINVPCPAQEAEGGRALHADFWDPVRRSLRERHGEGLHVLAWTGAAGDQVSRPMCGKAADARMRQLRGLTRLEEVARRIVAAWEDVHDAAKKDIRADVALRHRVEDIELPFRKVTEAEVAEARREAEKYAKDPAQRWNHRWNQTVVERYEAQQAGTEGSYPMELHALRLGDVAIASNDFELFTDFGIQMKARSPAVQTFVIQLAGPGSYVPTARAVRGGGYSAVVQSSRVGPEGGQMLVDRSVEALAGLWADEMKDRKEAR